jgi:capsular exopolysaccharide synthesis family protein
MRHGTEASGNTSPGRGMGAAPSVPGVPSRSQGSATAKPPGLSSGPDTLALFRALGRRWFLALALGLCAAGGVAAGAWLLLAPRFTAFAQVRVNAVPPWTINPHIDTPEGRSDFETYKRLQASEIKSRFVLLDALKKKEVELLKIVQEQPDPITWLEDELKVQIKDGSEIVSLTMTGENSDEVLELVRAIVRSYMTEVVAKERENRRDRLAKLQKTYNDSREKLHNKRKTLRETLAKSAGADPQSLRDRRVILLGTLAEVQKQRAISEAELKQAENRIVAHKATEATLPKKTVPDLAVTQTMDADEVAKRHLAKSARAQEIIDEYEPIAKKDEPTLVLAREMKQNMQAALAKRRAEIKKSLQERYLLQLKEDYGTALAQFQAALPGLTDQVKALRTKEESLSGEANKIQISSNEMGLLRDEIDQLGQFVADIAKKVNNLEVEVQSPPRVSLYQDAGLQKVDTKRRLMAVILGPIAAFGLVCFGVGWWEFRARRIQTADEVVTGLGMRVVGAVPALSGPALGRLLATSDAQDGRESSLLESIDAIRTMLLRDATVDATRVIMVTSAVAGEGKTTLASNLATSLARAGRKTLLIDCDLRSPAAHQLFEQTLQPGFSEVLLGEIDLIDAIRPTTAIDGLWLVPAGEWDREVLQALAKRGVQELFDRLKEEFDFIVVDSHPVLPATDSLLIGQYVDAVILSLLKDVSQIPHVHAASQRLSSLGIRVLGAVVNGMPMEGYQSAVAIPVLASR